MCFIVKVEEWVLSVSKKTLRSELRVEIPPKMRKDPPC